jgi:hypothetical protein
MMCSRTFRDSQIVLRGSLSDLEVQTDAFSVVVDRQGEVGEGVAEARVKGGRPNIILLMPKVINGLGGMCLGFLLHHRGRP